MFAEGDFLAPSLVLFAFVVYYGFLWYNTSGASLRARGISLPPGPKQKWITGNLHQLPRAEPWLTYESWSKTYGPIVYFRVFKNKTIVLNSSKVVLDLLESRSSIYSDRPTIWMGGELAGRKRSVFWTSFMDSRFRLFRRLLQSGLNPRASKSYRPIQMQETKVLLQGLATSPEAFSPHIRRNAVAVILKVAYGYQVASNDDPLVRHLDEGFQLLGTLMIPGKYWIEFFPILRFLPAWFPGAYFKRRAYAVGQELSQIENIPFDWARKEIATGDFVESFTSKLLEEETALGQKSLEDIKWSAAALYVGGGETTVSALRSFILLMTLHPDIQRRAQEDIDSVAPNRLPTIDDYESLPYIRAIVKETVRWAPVAPVGLPHRVMEDDIYENYFIPKGTRVIANIWAITHDEEIYPESHVFDPSRHLGSTPQPDPFKFVFGFGRRTCPGAHLAEMSLFLNMASILAVFKISKAVDENGLEIMPEIAWMTGATMNLKPFKCQIQPRSNEHLSLLA
ncbi:hypothetical protein GALMADRAFT_60016 [Galerina marginata CBS 339.88]|uniref:Cytochrome P450 n=1 Tax=Galerina marginata (strain CBS 339.88) TaxID=685588 RepID=A0A067TI54_GALM3|nr:hypothetical protein GALMADRAFT_60016 [Galerina marginata CBS 339.88]